MRREQEKDYWNNAAFDDNVRDNFIIDKRVNDEDCINAIMSFKDTIDFEFDVYNFPAVVELGSGIGRLTEKVADIFKNSEIVGMDVSEEMVKLAKQNSTHPNCRYYVGNGSEILSGDERAQLVYSMVMFQHTTYDNILQYFKESYRVLQPNGVLRFQFIEGNEDEPFSKHYSIEVIKKDLESIGFTVNHVDRGIICKEWTWMTAVKYQ